jgi:CRISPR-associated endonuclease/helicase Cas3
LPKIARHLKKVAAVVGNFHDTGKFLNRYFQDKLRGILYKDKYTHHSYLSMMSLLGFLLPGNHQYRSYRDMVIALICIIKHHGGIPNLDKLINDKELKQMRDYITEVQSKGLLPDITEFRHQIGFDGDTKPVSEIKDSLIRCIFSRADKINSIFTRISEEDRLGFWLDLRMVFSCLVAADKQDAGDHKLDINDKFLRKKFHKGIKAYIDNLSKVVAKTENARKLNLIRTEMRKVAVQNLIEVVAANPDRRLFQLTYPTGAGKTVILYCCGSVIQLKKGSRRIIYSVPFLSITDQVATIIEEIFPNEEDNIQRIDSKAQPDEDLDYDLTSSGDDVSPLMEALKKFIKNFIKFTLKKDISDISANKILKQELQEICFSYPLITTTFVQMFQTLTTASNRGLMRYNGLSGCIFLIDEIQALPPRLYNFLVALLDAFCRRFDSYAVISSATMPYFDIPTKSKEGQKMFPGYMPPIEIGDISYFDDPIFNRYDIVGIKTKMTVDSIAEKIRKEEKSTLVILNTKKDAKRVYKRVKKTGEDAILLTSLNCDRQDILDLCQKKLDNHERFFLISTNLIEAGVDIDFCTVYREIAPLPNIIQSAGRGNRNGNLYPDRATIYVFDLIDDKGRSRSKCIYNGDVDGPSLEYAKKIFLLSDRIATPELELLSLQKAFFMEQGENLYFGTWDFSMPIEDEEEDEEEYKTKPKRMNFVDLINGFQYGDIGRFRLIPECRYGAQVQFYVPESDEDKRFEKLVEYQAAIQQSEEEDVPIKTRLANKRKLHLHLREMMPRVVQMNLGEKDPPLSELAEYEGMVSHLYKLKLKYYSKEYGITWEEQQ